MMGSLVLIGFRSSRAADTLKMWGWALWGCWSERSSSGSRFLLSFIPRNFRRIGIFFSFASDYILFFDLFCYYLRELWFWMVFTSKKRFFFPFDLGKYVVFNGVLQFISYTKEKNAILFTYPPPVSVFVLALQLICWIHWLLCTNVPISKIWNFCCISNTNIIILSKIRLSCANSWACWLHYAVVMTNNCVTLHGYMAWSLLIWVPFVEDTFKLHL